MTSAFDGYNYLVRLERGEKLIERLKKFVADNDIKGGWVSGIGGLAWANLNFYKLDTHSYEWTRVDEPIELTSLQGSIAWQDKEPVLHLHATVSDRQLHCLGGHLDEAEVAGTVEVFIHVWNKDRLQRRDDDKTGLHLLDI